MAWLSFGLAPQGATQFQLLINKQDAMTEFDTLVPGRFQLLRDGSRVTYTETMSDDRINLGGVFISEKKLDEKKDHGITVLVAEKGRQEIKPDGTRYLILDNGYRYDGNPGQADYRAIKYDTYGALLPKPDISEEVTDRDAISDQRAADRRRQPAQPGRTAMAGFAADSGVHRDADGGAAGSGQSASGRFLKLLPAILLYMAYLTILIAARGALEKGKIPIGPWPVVGACTVPVHRTRPCSTGSLCA